MAARAAATAVPAPAPVQANPKALHRQAQDPEAVHVARGNWTADANGNWKFTDENGEPYVNRWGAVENPYANAQEGDQNYGWFRFDENGDMITGWFTDPEDGNTYYMNPEEDGTQGMMMTGWVTIGGKEYYFNPESDGTQGRMYRNETTPDGHRVDENGAKIQ